MNKSTKIVLILIGALTLAAGILSLVRKKNMEIAFGGLIIGAGLIVLATYDKEGKSKQEKNNSQEGTQAP
ncbi:MAG: hypothetical protein H3C48_02690 [Chitinophagaceae bacterium]|nr:hypothetical protein [Chitinophagaceae bacterium]